MSTVFYRFWQNIVKGSCFLVLTFSKMLNTYVGSTILKENRVDCANLSLIYNTLRLLACVLRMPSNVSPWEMESSYPIVLVIFTLYSFIKLVTSVSRIIHNIVIFQENYIFDFCTFFYYILAVLFISRIVYHSLT